MAGPETLASAFEFFVFVQNFGVILYPPNSFLPSRSMSVYVCK